jgi:hypothetical protein
MLEKVISILFSIELLYIVSIFFFVWTTLFMLLRFASNFAERRIVEARELQDRIIRHNLDMRVPMTVEIGRHEVIIRAVPVPSPVPSPDPSPDPAGKNPAGKPPQPPLGADSC